MRALPILAGIFWAAASSAQSPSPPWQAGETLVYDVKFGIIPAGRAELSVRGPVAVPAPALRPAAGPAGGPGASTGSMAYLITALAESNAFVDVFYKVRDKSESWLDAGKFVTHRFEQHNREGKYVFENYLELDWTARTYDGWRKVRDREPEIKRGELSGPVVDILASLYLTRTRDLDKEAEFKFDVLSGKTWPLAVKVLKREEVKVPAGKFDCHLVEPFLRDAGLFIQKGKKLQVWLTADEKRIPVLMRAEIYVGHVTAELREIRQEPAR